MDAMHQYGLIDFIGESEDQLAYLTSLAHRITGSKMWCRSIRLAALRQAAQSPLIFAELRKRFGDTLPTGSVVEDLLNKEFGYLPSLADLIAANYRDTMRYAAFDETTPETTVQPTAETSSPPAAAILRNIHVGDYVYYEHAGAIELGDATRVVAVDERSGEKKIFLEGMDWEFSLRQLVLCRESKSLEGRIRRAARLILEENTADSV
jgi:hypothetical protein